MGLKINMRSGLRLAVKTLIFTLVLLAVYYFSFIRPELALPNALVKSQSILASQHFNLLQNRLTLLELTRSDSTAANFNEEKSDLLSKLDKSNKDGLKQLKAETKLPKIYRPFDQTSDFLNNQLAQAYLDLAEKNRRLLQNQQLLIRDLVSLDNKMRNIFLYDPEIDLIQLNLATQKTELIKRSQSAIGGLTKIKAEVASVGESGDLAAKIDEANQSLEDLMAQLENNDLQAANRTRVNLVNKFVDLKKIAQMTEANFVKSDRSVSLLVDQTNILLEYDYWLSQIFRHLRNIEDDGDLVSLSSVDA